ncbi:SIR2 family protein [Agrobacterium sp. a22-2]|uniref:SIR2 family NAD-dependent protein deacylase n=1 Tax=Agrobacterium sp. a22-2 TaxID=2283840 RepID=UPI001444CB5B|nr:SIR2 family protein [Agrobacterium sp. a22-2]NKN34795.1 SIR2 family protein [Agrobacterium sp. a22-2]
MNAILNTDFLFTLDGEEGARAVEDIGRLLRVGDLIPYLGPGLLALDGAVPAVPVSPEEVAAALHARAPAPSRIRTNMWSVAQYIEQRRHRVTLRTWMAEIFAADPQPSALHRWLVSLPLPLVVDTWYDGAMRAAFAAAGRPDVPAIQGITRSGEFRDIWTKAYDGEGQEIDEAVAEATATVLYEPHGGARPAGNFLVADSDYVEVLTEIDIQTPIPDLVRTRRSNRGFLFLGCRFHDQMLRTYARQIMKRSKGPHYAIMDAAALTRNERRFLAGQGITLIDMPLAEAAGLLTGEHVPA